MGSISQSNDAPKQAKRGHASLQPIYTLRRNLSIIVIGAGASGLLLAYKIQRNFDDFSLEVFEKNPDMTGTWYENRYPGCACDVPAHNYTWSFEPKPDWSANYAGSREIHDYFKNFAVKNDLGKYVRLRHKVIDARWDDGEALWRVDVEDLATGSVLNKTCHVLLNAGGVLNDWKWPDIPGLKSFGGDLVHSADWPEQGLDLAGKRVGLIGNGSSAIQILPAIKDKVGSVVTFIRSATWITPVFGEGTQQGAEYREYSDEEKQAFARDPEAHLKFRREYETSSNAIYSVFQAGSEEQIGLRQAMEQKMRDKIRDPELEKVLVPDWAVGCRRLTPGTGYIEALSDEKVQTVCAQVTEVTPTGVVCDDGKGEYPVDVLICATGFDTTYKPRFTLRGTSGADLARMWKDEPRAYFGMAVDHFPNYLMTLGPNSPLGNGPVLINIEAQADYMVKLMGKFQKENLRSFRMRSDAVREFNEWKDEYMKETIWADSCRSWYKGNTTTGKVVGLWPGSTLHYLEAIREPRWEDWILEREAGTNRFGYLGDGHSTIETQGLDYAYYLRTYDDSTADPVLKKRKKNHPSDGNAVEESDRPVKSGFLSNGGAENGVNGGASGVPVAVA
ncbi:hypothetical protein PspLS_00696 [Pyricularia sp. CBS 133598]|nr:hypothetical protein PspLS_00696 [Pyricularia sp. CBS 133598]